MSESPGIMLGFLGACRYLRSIIECVEIFRYNEVFNLMSHAARSDSMRRIPPVAHNPFEYSLHFFVVDP